VVEPEFHARFSAFSRSYSYFLLGHAVRPALAAGRVGWYHRPLDVNAMRQAASCLIGQHDFSSFRAAECQARTPVKQLDRLDVSEHQGLIRFDLGANAFLHHMVRNIVGASPDRSARRSSSPACRRNPPDVSALLAARDRRAAPPTFMPDGLYLTGVGYPPQFGLPQSAETSRLTLWR